jgi:2-hydroxycyclohexanecarboxyl-CoA dehydrogenase
MIGRREPVDLAGRTVLVTGAGSGIGRATALAFARRSAVVVSVDIAETGARRTADDCLDAGAPASFAHAIDVRDHAAVDELAARVHDAHGPLDVLVNNAGVGMSGPFAEITVDDWKWIRSVNLDGVVHCCAAFGRPMLGRGGHVVNVASGLAYTATPTEAAYSATKAAVLALSRSLRADWRQHGVEVTAVCPGVINTPILTATRFFGQEAEASARARTDRVFRQGHPPEKVADAIVGCLGRDRKVLPVGAEAHVGWWLSRLAPTGVQDVVVRLALRR